MATKQSAVSSVITGPPICQCQCAPCIAHRHYLSWGFEKQSRWHEETDEFRCTSTFLDGDLLRRSLNFWYYEITCGLLLAALADVGRAGLAVKIARLDIDGFALSKDLASFLEFPGVAGYEY